MATTYKSPGVYVEEISKLPPSVAQVETAIPAFIGYTENDSLNGLSLVNKPKRIKSLNDFEQIFGFPKQTDFTNDANPVNGIKIKKDGSGAFVLDGDLKDPYGGLQFRLHYCLQMYFANGGGPCYIISSGKYGDASFANSNQMAASLAALRKEDEPTMIVFTDAVSLSKAEFYSLYSKALTQAAELMDRVVIADLYLDTSTTQKMADFKGGKMDMYYDVGGGTVLSDDFRNGIGNNNLTYAAAYYPWLVTTLAYYADESKIPVTGGIDALASVKFLRKYPAPGQANVDNPQESLYHMNSQLYATIKKQVDNFKVILPPASTIAGVYAMVDSTRGVWKAPANVSLNYVFELLVKIDDVDQQDMNVTGTGKSINAIRFFTGKGILVWGARTLAGNDNEWRYISVRRFYNMVEESVKKATEPFVFEPNDANTWTKVRAMIENFLVLQWRDGALMGAKPDEAFFVRVGLGETMTALDILEGRMIVEIGLAVVRPAEFIILKFSHKMVVS
ncbi:MAG: phage tail sheath C-terminal domain-containing protein [Bacteroidota bacterium]|nr:phage tail sheath C-terminal domain-containing protein [Bacteroidota bacterium]